jgi:hypothetical protein
MSYLKIGDVVSFDYSHNNIGWIGIVIKQGFVNPNNKFEKQILVQPRKIKMLNETSFIIGKKYGAQIMQVVKQATKCKRQFLDGKRAFILNICKSIDNTYPNYRQLTNPSKIAIYQLILDNIKVCNTVLLLESELLTSTEYIKTRFPKAHVDIPNPLSSSFLTKMKNINFYAMTIQMFLLSFNCVYCYDFVWIDLCKSIKGDDNSDILPLVVEKNIISRNGFLAITCCLRGCNYDTTIGIILAQLNGIYELSLMKRYQPAMIFMMFKKL